MRRLLIFCAFTVCLIARGQELLITAAGRYQGGDGKVSVDATGSKKKTKYSDLEGKIAVELSVPDRDHLIYDIEWNGPVRKEGNRLIQDGVSGEGLFEPLPVVPARWAFCLVGKDQLWFFDGGYMFTRFKGTPEGLVSVQTCEDANLGKRAPGSLKRWIEAQGKPSRSPQNGK